MCVPKLIWEHYIDALILASYQATLQVGEYPVLFGPMGDKKLSFSRFLVFLRSLQDDVLRLEFESFGPDRSDTISSQEFASAVISNAFPKDFKYPSLSRCCCI